MDSIDFLNWKYILNSETLKWMQNPVDQFYKVFIKLYKSSDVIVKYQLKKIVKTLNDKDGYPSGKSNLKTGNFDI